MATAIGLAFLVATACLHHLLLMTATSLVPEPLRRSRWLPISVFSMLAVIHLVQIVAGGVVYVVLHHGLWPEAFGGSFQGTWSDYYYFSGMNFTTLGQTGMNVVGPLRIVAMIQSLAGFMVLTWSASYLYGTCRQQFMGEYEG
ncbi:ion channel [Roseivivax marinus]|uniref:ion channel n=1 Tax=Roseivivax marinus TaxID=1379903 RepID=UPI00273DE40F|nr:ion channel [Roseivivax marinus]